MVRHVLFLCAVAEKLAYEPTDHITVMNQCFRFTVSSPTAEESFQFGGYMPSAASSSQSRSRGGLARPDTAPSSTKRSVRFSDDLGLGDELFGSERPSTAPGERSGRRQAKRGGKDENSDGSYLDDNKTPPEGNKPARREITSNGRDSNFAHFQNQADRILPASKHSFYAFSLREFG